MLISFDKDQLVMRIVRSANKTKWDTWKTKYLPTLISPVGSLVQHTHPCTLTLSRAFHPSSNFLSAGVGKCISPALPLQLNYFVVMEPTLTLKERKREEEDYEVPCTFTCSRPARLSGLPLNIPNRRILSQGSAVNQCRRSWITSQTQCQCLDNSQVCYYYSFANLIYCGNSTKINLYWFRVIKTSSVISCVGVW